MDDADQLHATLALVARGVQRMADSFGAIEQRLDRLEAAVGGSDPAGDERVGRLVEAVRGLRDDLAIATTMGLTTLSLMHIVAAVEARDPIQTVFSRATLENRRFVQLIGLTLVLTFLVTELNFLQRMFDTVSLTSSQWGICLLGPIVYLALAELVKLFDRRTHRETVVAVVG